MPQHRTLLLVGSCLSVLLASGCGEPPQKVPNPVAGAPASPHASTPTAVMRFSGELTLQGSLASAQSGSIFIIVRQPGSRMPTLTRKYEIGDPLWIKRGDERVLHFSLDERDNMGGAAAPGGEKMEIEARFDPDGLIDTKEGTEKQVAQVRAGATDIAIVLRPAAAGVPAASGG